MIEADVVLGRLEQNATGELIPIMAHPPNDISDLSLENFLFETHQAGRSVKIDFKTIGAMEASMGTLKDMTPWVNVCDCLKLFACPYSFYSIRVIAQYG